jgi:hypothetical protein
VAPPPRPHPLAPPPDWLLDLLRPKEHKPPALPRAVGAPGVGTAYGRRALAGLLSELAQTAPGNRNNALNYASYRLGLLVQAGHLPPTVADLVARVGEGLGLSPREVAATLKSGFHASLNVSS